GPGLVATEGAEEPDRCLPSLPAVLRAPARGGGELRPRAFPLLPGSSSHGVTHRAGLHHQREQSLAGLRIPPSDLTIGESGCVTPRSRRQHLSEQDPARIHEALLAPLD